MTTSEGSLTWDTEIFRLSAAGVAPNWGEAGPGAWGLGPTAPALGHAATHSGLELVKRHVNVLVAHVVPPAGHKTPRQGREEAAATWRVRTAS